MVEASRAKAAAVLLLLLALATAGWALVDAILFLHNQKYEETTMYAESVAPFRDLLPRDEPVGCAMDLELNGAPYIRAYYNIRYALSPVVVAWRSDCRYVIGLFANPENVDKFLRENGYEVVRLGNNGTLLMKKRAER